MKKIYIQPELTFEPIESKGPGNTPDAPGTTTPGDGSGVNDDELESLGFSFE